jgi:hypothetical protein
MNFNMKNQRILLIASILLVLCVFEKQARNKALRSASVEKMYNIPQRDEANAPEFTQERAKVSSGDKSLYDPADIFEFASADSTLEASSVKFSDRSMLNIASESKLLKY